MDATIQPVGSDVIWNGIPHETLVIPANQVRRQRISEGLRSGFPLSRE
jgi:hypothetical protein